MRIRRITCACAAILALTLATGANAQLGGLGKGLLKKATDKAAKKAVDNAMPEGPASTTGAYAPAVIGTPLSADTLDLALRGLSAMSAHLAPIAPLSARRQDLYEKLSQSQSANEKARERYDESARKVADCQDQFFDALDHQREQDMQKKMAEMRGDQKKMAEMANAAAELARRSGELQQKGDMAGAEKLQRDFYAKMFGVDYKADTAAAVAKCGPRPPKPAFLVEQEKMSKEIDSIGEQIRERESAAESVGAKASGLSPHRFALARERLYTWLGDTSGGRPSKNFSSEENGLFSAHRAEIEKGFASNR